MGRVRRRLVWMRSSAAVGSDSAASPCLRRCMTLLTTVLAEILAAPSRDVEVVALFEAHLADDVGQQGGADELLGRQPLLAQRVLEQLPAAVLGVAAALGLEPRLDLVTGPRGLDQRQPVAGRPALTLGGQHLDDVAGPQLVGQRHDLAVDLGADAAVADVGVDLVGEVQRRGPRGQRLDLALGRSKRKTSSSNRSTLRFSMNSRGSAMSCCQSMSERSHLTLPSESLRTARLPVRPGAPSLYIQCAAIPNSARSCISRVRIWISSGRPSGPITVVCSEEYMLNFGMATKSLNRPGSGFHSEWIDAHRAVAVLHRVHDHAHRGQVVDLVELPPLLGHLGVDGVEVLGPPGDVGVDAQPLASSLATISPASEGRSARARRAAGPPCP